MTQQVLQQEAEMLEKTSIRFYPEGKLEVKSPTVVSLIMTDVCNLQCRHCQNFWREEDIRTSTLTRDQIDLLLSRFVEAGIFHVVISGGEPLLFQDNLEYLVKKLLDNEISISLNSNLILATPDKMKRLRDLGVDHILTSLNSHEPEVNDYVSRGQDSLSAIRDGIATTVAAGIRVSSNMIIQRINMDHVYDVGRLLSELGVRKMFSTRSVMPPFAREDERENYFLSPEESKKALDEMLRVKSDFGLEIGTLVSYPLCFLGDLERYRDFVGRGCPSQSGFAIGVYANGDACTCCHSEKIYGNIFESRISEVYKNMEPWRKEQHYAGCDGCSYLNICESGCRMMAHVATGSCCGKDPLMTGPDMITVPYRPAPNLDTVKRLKALARCIVPERLRFRKEDGFYLINVRWGSTTFDSDAIAKFLLEHQASGNSFNYLEFPGTFDDLVSLYHRDIIEVENSSSSKDMELVGHNIAVSFVR